MNLGDPNLRENQVLCDVPADASYPSEFDWRDYNLVTRVKDQGSCGSCYIFASIGVFETQIMIDKFSFNGTGPIPPNTFELSEQTELNCAPGHCNGGFVSEVFDDFQRFGAQEYSHGEPHYDGRVSA